MWRERLHPLIHSVSKWTTGFSQKRYASAASMAEALNQAWLPTSQTWVKKGSTFGAWKMNGSHECPLKKSILLESDVISLWKIGPFFRGHSLVFWVFFLYFTNLHCQIILGIGFSSFFRLNPPLFWCFCLVFSCRKLRHLPSATARRCEVPHTTWGKTLSVTKNQELFKEMKCLDVC